MTEVLMVLAVIGLIAVALIMKGTINGFQFTKLYVEYLMVERGLTEGEAHFQMAREPRHHISAELPVLRAWKRDRTRPRA